MGDDSAMPTIQTIKYRNILNSHVQFTPEFIIQLEDGSIGTGAAPQGETISIYEDRKVSITPENIIQAVQSNGILGRPIDQEEFDQYLQQEISTFGRNNAYSLSLAFFNATKQTRSLFELFDKEESKLMPPRLCLNILNGGWHAYTNPVLSDFSEFMLVAKSDDIGEVIGEHNEIQKAVKSKLNTQTKTVVSGNLVNIFAQADNRAPIEFLLTIIESLGLTSKYDLMIDASAGDLWTPEGYRLAITDNSVYSSEQFLEYWKGIVKQYNLRFLEDPFREKDAECWHALTTSQQDIIVIGDNYYSSDAARIEDGAAGQHTHAVIIKPNQAGTITNVRRAVQTAQRTGQIVITSHRSISTEETFISLLTCVYGAQYIKIGPLETDYSAIVRLNEIIRLTEAKWQSIHQSAPYGMPIHNTMQKDVTPVR
jgi:enolase